mmetsp:Transcript_16523/g.32908  ORF Transcript_16523/g.32908 Transcript_16523/m.32908 type:complete len:292 (-) Transcript_16523:32-907(-)
MGEQVLSNVMFNDDQRGPAPTSYGGQPQFRNVPQQRQQQQQQQQDGWYGQVPLQQQQQQQQQYHGGPVGGGPNGPNISSSYNPNFVSQGMSGNMSGGMTGSMSSGPMAPGGAQGTFDDYDNEPPLLEELGVNVPHIIAKTKAIMTPMTAPDSHLYDDTDMAGPLCFALLLGVTLMLTGKLHFGYIYGFGVFGCLALSAVVNLMHPQGVDTWRVFSILGYSLVPVNLLAALAVLLNLSASLFGFILCALTVGWSTFASVRVFDKCLNMREQRWLVAYPIALLYSCFVLITVF